MPDPHIALAEHLFQEEAPSSKRCGGRAAFLCLIGGLCLAVVFSSLPCRGEGGPHSAVQEPAVTMALNHMQHLIARRFVQPSSVWKPLQPARQPATVWHLSKPVRAGEPLQLAFATTDTIAPVRPPVPHVVENEYLALEVARPDSLREYLPSLPELPSPLLKTRDATPENFVDDMEVVLASPLVRANEAFVKPRRAYFRAGPRESIAFSPSEVRAAIVTCGGICPGLNTVVRELVECLWYQYGVRDILGVKDGYKGVANSDVFELTPDRVNEIHRQGGTILGSSRGAQDINGMVDALIARGVNQVFVIGGDGTIRGANRIADAARARGVMLSVGVVPKTIDNDIPLIDKSFGFETAVSEATKSIDAADIERKSFPNGLAVVRLMGRHAGFIAVHASLAARNVDLCLIPEQPFYLEGPGGVFEFIEERIRERGHALVVVAEGAGADLLDREKRLQSDGAEKTRDASGNVQLSGDIGQWLGAKLKANLSPVFKDSGGVTLKLIDPTYMIRAVPANPADNIYCAELAHACVHGIMHGFTNFMTGSVGAQEALIPLPLVVGRSNVVSVRGSLWSQLRFATGQPSFDNPPIPQACMEETPTIDECDLPPDITECDIEQGAETPAGGCISVDLDDRGFR